MEKNVMEKITIEQGEGGMFTVYQGGKSSGALGWDETLGLIAALTIPEGKKPCVHWMKTEEEHEVELTGRTSKPSEEPDRPENPDKKNEAWSDHAFKKAVEATTAFVETDRENRCAITIFGNKESVRGQVLGAGDNLIHALAEFLSNQGEDEARVVKQSAMILATLNEFAKL